MKGQSGRLNYITSSDMLALDAMGPPVYNGERDITILDVQVSGPSNNRGVNTTNLIKRGVRTRPQDDDYRKKVMQSKQPQYFSFHRKSLIYYCFFSSISCIQDLW